MKELEIQLNTFINETIRLKEQLEIAESVRSRLTPQYQDATVLQEAADELQAIENKRAEAIALENAMRVATGGVAVGGTPTLEETLTNITGGSN